MTRIALVGDFDETVPAHRAIPMALALAAQQASTPVQHEWLPTAQLDTTTQLAAFDGIWCVPASPYRSMDGALLAIRHARELGLPFLGTCGGFQHAVIEYARNVLGWLDADHGETAPGAARALITPLACSLVEARGDIRFVVGSRLHTAYGSAGSNEGYRCSYGLDEQYRAELLAGPLRVAAEDEQGDVRGIELDGHPFFVATLFQPERAALDGVSVPPLVAAFVAACSTRD